jgi:hypothetical protein
MTQISRNQFLKRLASGAATLAVPAISFAQTNAQKPDPLKPELVKEFVIKGHNDLDGLKQMLKEQPALIYATWDWGGGDFETALGGASHMGRADIANYLIQSGARMDIFAVAMLGKVEIIKMMLTTFPEMVNCKGAHGITLLTHAQKGGENALGVVEYLKSLGIQK